ncbi:hypothetical protein EDD86DRAFT_137035 [Gorgonomyces haynaldii]|nr:hypothetical protein EDD86DRAFT_137035 [Gorgonomyces haynaldii]
MPKKLPILERKRLGDTQQLISQFHTLNKRLAKAKADKNTAEQQQIESQLEEMGGLHLYQKASLKGGSIKKGFAADQWLVPLLKQEPKPMRMLDVGAISGELYQKYKFLQVVSIDLNSQTPAVIKQDFMLRPKPESDQDKFHIVCLSLVINFVGDITQRGDMLQHTRHFLLENGLLYIVLPLPCINNSRYMDHEHFLLIMISCGYKIEHFKFSTKLAYYLFRIQDPTRVNVPKKELHPGGKRNNFSINLRF